MERENNRLYRKFLRACNNFSSDKHNLDLFFNGFIHYQINDINLYKNTPRDILQTITIFTYGTEQSVSTHTGDSFNVTLNNLSNTETKNDLLEAYDKCAKWSDDNQKLTWTHPAASTSNMDRLWSLFGHNLETTYTVYGRFFISRNDVARKIWRLQIIDYAKDKPIDLDIGFVADDKDWTLNEYDTTMLRLGDIITILWLRHSELLNGNMETFGRLCFGINGTVWKTYDKVPESKIGCLRIILKDSVTLQFLND